MSRAKKGAEPQQQSIVERAEHADAARLDMLDVAQLYESKLNPRAAMDKAKFAELVESVKRQGILQPLLVRPAQGKPGCFEVVSGHRRLRAAREAELAVVPVVIRDLTDQETLELQIVENLQRADLHPLEEAHAYETLHVKHGRDVESLAAQVGKSRGYVYARLKLCDLAEGCHEAFFAGRYDVSVALQLARIPSAKLQVEALKDLLRNIDSEDTISPADARRQIVNHYMLRLVDAQFDVKDAGLVPGVPACYACPKRTGNQRELFGDVKDADLCTDPVCHRAKTDAAWAILRKQSIERGHTVMSAVDAKKLYPSYASHLSAPEGYVRADGDTWDSGQRRSWKQAVGKNEPPITVARDPLSGRIDVLYKASDARKAAAATSGAKSAKGASSSKSKPESWTPQPHLIEPVAHSLMSEAIREKVRAGVGVATDRDSVVRLLARLFVSDITAEDALEAAGFKEKDFRSDKARQELFEAHLQKLEGAELLDFVVSALLCTRREHEQCCERLDLKPSVYEKKAIEMLRKERAAKLVEKKAAGRKVKS